MPISTLLIAAAAAGAPALPTPPQAKDRTAEIQHMLADPKTAERLSGTLDALSKALLALPVGEIQAAVEGREPTAEERKLTVGELKGVKDRDFKRDLDGQIAGGRQAMQAGMKALSVALPAMIKGLSDAQTALDRAAANLPSRNYPKR